VRCVSFRLSAVSRRPSARSSRERLLMTISGIHKASLALLAAVAVLPVACGGSSNNPPPQPQQQGFNGQGQAGFPPPQQGFPPQQQPGFPQQQQPQAGGFPQQQQPPPQGFPQQQQQPQGFPQQ